MAVTPQLASYQNRNGAPIEFAIGTLPGKPWTSYNSLPGEVIRGPAGYREKFIAAGYTPLTDEEAELERMIAEEAAKKAAEPARQLPVKAEAQNPKGRRAERSPTG